LEALENAGFIDIKLVPHLLRKNLQYNNNGEEEDVSLSKTFIECRKPI
jgi:hypothetical protein